MSVYECTICLGDEYSKAVRTNCGHTFCDSCLIQHLCADARCPLCRTRVKRVQSVQLLLDQKDKADESTEAEAQLHSDDAIDSELNPAVIPVLRVKRNLQVYEVRTQYQ
jgi:Zinc finger, C3HC4 type (RING finger)